MKHRVLCLWMIAIAGVLGAACQKPIAPAAVSQTVTVTTVEQGTIDQTVLFTGNILAQSAFDVYPRATGKVAKKLVAEGDPVKKGQPIFMVARDEIGFTYRLMPVVSFVDGIVGTLMADVGTYVSPEKPVAIVVNPGIMRVRLDIPERFLDTLQVGTAVTLTVDSMGDLVFAGNVHSVSPVVTEKTRTAALDVWLANADGKLRHGMFGRMNLTVARHADVPTVPIGAISWEGEKRFVYRIGPTLWCVLKSGGAGKTLTPDACAHVWRCEIQTDFRNDTRVEVTSGVALGDRLAEGELITLENGEAVTVAAAPSAAPPSDTSAPDDDTSEGDDTP